MSLSPSSPPPLSIASRLTYGFGDFGQNILFQITAFHLLFYLTEEVGLSATFLGALFLGARIWDGINDPIMGYVASRTHTRWGSYRPYLLWGAPLLALSMYWLFAVPNWALSAQAWYVGLSYVAFGMVFTFYNIPYGSLTAVMTQSYHERSLLTGYRMVFAMAGGIFGATLFTPLVAYWGGGKEGYALAAAIFAVVVLLSSLPTFFLVKESVPVRDEENPDPRAASTFLRSNGPFWWLCLAFGSAFAAYSLFAATLPFAAKYLFGREEITVSLILMLMGITGLTIPAWTWAAQRIGKRGVFLWGALCYGLGYVLLAWVPATIHVSVLYAIFAIMGVGNGAAAFTSWAMLPDTIEYGKWKTGLRAPGLTYGVFGFFFKLGLGIGAALAGGLLAWSGYPSEGITPERLLPTIRAGISWIPLAITALAWWAVWKYPITAAMHVNIQNDLATATLLPPPSSTPHRS